MLLVLDSNEYIFALGLSQKPACVILLDTILDTSPRHSLRIPRLIVEEVSRHLAPEDFKEFLGLLHHVTTVDEDSIVPFEVGARYELEGLKPADAFIAAYVEWTGADALVTENRHFLSRHSTLPFRVVTAADCLTLLRASR